MWRERGVNQFHGVPKIYGFVAQKSMGEGSRRNHLKRTAETTVSKWDICRLMTQRAYGNHFRSSVSEITYLPQLSNEVVLVVEALEQVQLAVIVEIQPTQEISDVNVVRGIEQAKLIAAPDSFERQKCA